MHSSAVVASTSGASISGGQAAGVAGDGVAPEDVGFAALFAAQIQGGAGVLLIPVMADVAVDALSLVDSKQQNLPPEVAVDPTLAGMLLAQMAPPPAEAAPQDVVLQVSAESDVADVAVLSGMQQIPVEAKGEIASWFSPQSAKSTVEGKAIVPSTRIGSDADLELAERPLLGVGQEKVEEFAASGKVLPLNSGVDVKGNETRMTHLVAAENQRLSESVLPAAAMTVNQTVLATEFKATAATVQTPIGSAGWGDAVGQKVVWMASQQQQVAELHLNPPHLGPMEVRLTINNDQVTALFVSHQPVVREAIEAAMPRLREMFADNGMMLGNATVSSDSLPQQQASGQDDKNSGSSQRLDYHAVNGPMSGSIGGVLPLRSDGRGLVDLFA